MFVYTNEAHPGEHVPHHDTWERKLANARLLRDEIGIRRPILVDDLTGTVHRAFGGMPNMTWVFDRGGLVIYKANWTSAANVEGFLERYRAGRESGSQRVAMSRYETEQIEFRRADPARFQRALERNGPRAVTEFDNARAIWERRGQ
ncbi:hypothetical protein GCM10025762_54020 [Haloechinothrix salitolerans]